MKVELSNESIKILSPQIKPQQKWHILGLPELKPTRHGKA